MDVNTAIHSDCLTWMKSQPTNSVDLVFGSPPYELARTYGVDFDLRDEEWVYWMTDIVREAVRISKGLVAFVVEGQTRKFRYSATPLLLMADLHRLGIVLRKPPIFHRVGIPGSGGPDWIRNDYEFVICCTSGGKLPWSNNTACGHPPKWAPGGEMSHRLGDGTRRNQWGGSPNGTGHRRRSGKRCKYHRPSHEIVTKKRMSREQDGTMREQDYIAPKLANPGNVNSRQYTSAEVANILRRHGFKSNLIKCIVGGGVMGSKLTHENEAPFPESLAEFYIKSFCPPDGIVYDPFSGSGTTAAVAVKNGRNWVATDTRRSQIELTSRRVQEAQCHVQPISK